MATDLFTLIQTVAAVITALAATGILGLAVQIYRRVLEHERILLGEDAVEGWNGIVSMVQRHNELIEEHREALQECDKL